jgi:hypothetical protein
MAQELQQKCCECGMVVERSNNYHPYAACLMYKACKSETTVRENLAAVIEYGKSLAEQ